MRHTIASLMLLGAVAGPTVVISSGCAALRGAPPSDLHASHEFRAQTAVYGHELTLHLASAAGPTTSSAPLILYASGDGGWFGAAVDMYRTIAESGLNEVGFSTKAFMKNAQSTRGALTTRDVVNAFQAILDTGRRELQLPDDAPIVLTGWSRGASLAVLVAGNHHVDPHVRGVVAIGLAARDDLNATEQTDDDSAGDAESGSEAQRREEEFDMYALISDVAPRRCVVIQASRDGYLPAAQARDRFGPDSDVKRFLAIEARNHRFTGGEVAFAEALRQAIRWVSMSAAKPAIADLPQLTRSQTIRRKDGQGPGN